MMNELKRVRELNENEVSHQMMTSSKKVRGIDDGGDDHLDPFGKLLSQFDCPVCYETLASVCTLQPCGCNFCFDCIYKWNCEKNKKTCPCCNQLVALSKSSANKRLDSIIREFLKSRSLHNSSFKTEEEQREQIAFLEEWENRVEAGIALREKFKRDEQQKSERTLSEQGKNIFIESIRQRANQILEQASQESNLRDPVFQARAESARNALRQISRLGHSAVITSVVFNSHSPAVANAISASSTGNENDDDEDSSEEEDNEEDEEDDDQQLQNLESIEEEQQGNDEEEFNQIVYL